jgi:DNA mismatch repair protein MutS
LNNINGILLYGINSIGKSSLIKSVGLSVYLAQCGMYVPCSKYNCHLIDKIFTRLPGSDDIMNNQSSFTLEIKDIRDILDNSTKNSIILADEICQSTETMSGISIIATTIKMLTDIKCKFIISSHLNELVSLDNIKNNKSINIKHLSISKDNGKIIFDRKLKDGPFHSLYGLEICKSLGMSDNFLNYAENIRKKLINYNQKDILPQKTKYNSEMYYNNICEICNKQNLKYHIHHIQEQHTANSDNKIGIIHKNDKFNLVTLCEQCHKDVHNNKLLIRGYIQTNNGFCLDYIKK